MKATPKIGHARLSCRFNGHVTVKGYRIIRGVRVARIVRVINIIWIIWAISSHRHFTVRATGNQERMILREGECSIKRRIHIYLIFLMEIKLNISNRLGCQLKLTKEMDGVILTIPEEVNNLYNIS